MSRPGQRSKRGVKVIFIANPSSKPWNFKPHRRFATWGLSTFEIHPSVLFFKTTVFPCEKKQVHLSKSLKRVVVLFLLCYDMMLLCLWFHTFQALFKVSLLHHDAKKNPYGTKPAPLQNDNWKHVTIANPTVFGGSIFETMMAKWNSQFFFKTSNYCAYKDTLVLSDERIFDPPRKWTLQCFKSVGRATIVGSTSR